MKKIKIKISEKLGTLSVYDIDGELETVLADLTKQFESYKLNHNRSDSVFDKMLIEWDRWGDGCSDMGCFVIKGVRDETDEELEERFSMITKQEAKERAMLASLKKKYE